MGWECGRAAASAETGNAAAIMVLKARLLIFSVLDIDTLAGGGRARAAGAAPW
jgi:hypothetical protein